MSVAVVDDEAPVRVALRRLLRLAEYTVTTFESGEEFLASLATQQPDCVLLDVHMPGITGLVVHARMRAANIDIPVVFVTASDTLDIEQSVNAVGAQLLRKPFSNDALLAAVANTIRGADE
jgi:FixJ family two-component response regulator